MWTIVKETYALPFRVFAFFMGHYLRNRARLRAVMARPRARRVFTGAIAATMLVWIVVGMMASDEDGNRLTEAARALWSDAQALGEQKKLMLHKQEGLVR